MTPIFFLDSFIIAICHFDSHDILFAMSALIALIITASIIGSFHWFLMRTVEEYSSYGQQGGSYREWREFEKAKAQLP